MTNYIFFKLAVPKKQEMALTLNELEDLHTSATNLLNTPLTVTYSMSKWQEILN